MQRTIPLLAALLLAQLALALGLNLTGPDLSVERSDAPLLALEKAAVDRVVIEGPAEARAVLAKTNGAWLLPDSGDFPANGDKIEGLLDRLERLERGRAVATSEEALARFKVRDKDFERRITFAAGDQILETLYLGTSPGRGRVHARTAEQDAVYAVDLATYEVPADASDWEDKTVLQIPKAEIESIAVAGLRMAQVPTEKEKVNEDKTAEDRAAAGGPPKEEPSAGDDAAAAGDAAGPSWTATGLAAGERLKPDAAAELARLLAGLRIGAVLGREEKPEYGLDEPALSLSLTRKDGEEVTYRLGKRTEEEGYVLKVSTRPEYFALPAFAAERLIEAASRKALVEAPGADDGSADRSAADG